MEISGQTRSLPHLSTPLLSLSLREVSASSPGIEPSANSSSGKTEVGDDIWSDKSSRHLGNQSVRLPWLRSLPSRRELNETIDTPIGSHIGVPASWKALTYPYS